MILLLPGALAEVRLSWKCLLLILPFERLRLELSKWINPTMVAASEVLANAAARVSIGNHDMAGLSAPM